MIGRMTWELCRRSDQSVLATLDQRLPGSRVDIKRLTPRTAQIALSLSDPASKLVSEGDTLLRCKVAGWPTPLFIGRITQDSFGYDDENESLVISAVDPWVQLSKTAIFSTSMGFGGGVYSYQSYHQDAVATMRDLIQAEASNQHGIVAGALPIGPSQAGTVYADGALAGGNFNFGSPSAAQAFGPPSAFADGTGGAPPPIARTTWLKGVNWGFNVPAAATIVGVKVDTYPWCGLNTSNTSGNMWTGDSYVQLMKGGVVAGVNKANGSVEWPAYGLGGTEPNPAPMRSYGNSADLWGLSLTPADVNDPGFGIALAAHSQIVSGLGVANYWAVQYMRITVYWTWTDASGDIYSSPMTKDVSYPAGSNVADAIQALVSLAGGPEYELVPKEASNGDLATFNAYVPRQGDDMTALAMTLGVDDNDTLTGISYAPAIDTLINSYVAIGDVAGTQNMGGLDYPLHPAVQATHNASVAQYGKWETAEDLAGTTDTALLTQSARAMVAANAYPLHAFSVTLDDNSPSFAPDGTVDASGLPDADFWIGDTIRMHAELPEETLLVDGRVVAATLTEDEAGVVDVSLSCEPEAQFAGVSTSNFFVVKDSADGTVPPPPDDSGLDNPCAPVAAAPDPCPKHGKGKGKGKKKKKK